MNVGSDIRISNQFLITRALHFAQLAFETFKLYSVTQCDSDACLIIRLWLCKMESTSNQKLVANSNIACGKDMFISFREHTYSIIM